MCLFVMMRAKGRNMRFARGQIEVTVCFAIGNIANEERILFYSFFLSVFCSTTFLLVQYDSTFVLIQARTIIYLMRSTLTF